jgi:hypothetical protein
MARLVQLTRGDERRLARVDEPWLRVLDGARSVYELARASIARRDALTRLVEEAETETRIAYDEVYASESDWRLLPAVDVPGQPWRCLISGTGLTHLGSAQDRQKMHSTEPRDMTDSMRMFQLGMEGGKPKRNQIGAAPEWFYKGNGTALRAHGQPLVTPAHAEDGGEEAEVAGVYLVGDDGAVYRVGMCAGNEFADHVFEKKNYLNLAGSKLRTCALGPELVVNAAFERVPGEVRIERDGATLWSKAIETGEAAMCHSLANLEHHHFKFAGHRQPGDLHVHFFGAHSLSFGDGVRLRDGDWMQVRYEGFGRALRNPVRVENAAEQELVRVTALE